MLVIRKKLILYRQAYNLTLSGYYRTNNVFRHYYLKSSSKIIMKNHSTLTVFNLHKIPTEYFVPEVIDYYNQKDKATRASKETACVKRDTFEKTIAEYAAVRIW